MISRSAAFRCLLGLVAVGGVALPPAGLGAQNNVPGTILSGVVTGRYGGPVTGAKVTLVIRKEDSFSSDHFSATTDANGRYRIEVPIGVHVSDRVTHLVRVEAEGYGDHRADLLIPNRESNHDVDLAAEPGVTLQMAVGGNRWRDGLHDRFTGNFKRDFAQYDNTCDGDDGGTGFSGGAIVSARVRRGFFFRGGADFQKTGSASFKCVATGSGPTRELTIDGVRDYTTIHLFVGPAIEIGPTKVFANAGVTRWENDYDFSDQLLVNGQIVAGKKTDGKESGTNFGWALGVEQPIWGNFLVAGRWTRLQLNDAFPENNARLPVNGRMDQLQLWASYKFHLSGRSH